ATPPPTPPFPTRRSSDLAQQKAVDEHCTTEWALRVAAPWADYERAGVAKLQGDTASGREVYTITDAQLDEWRKAGEPVVKVWARSEEHTSELQSLTNLVC